MGNGLGNLDTCFDVHVANNNILVYYADKIGNTFVELYDENSQEWTYIWANVSLGR